MKRMDQFQTMAAIRFLLAGEARLHYDRMEQVAKEKFELFKNSFIEYFVRDKSEWIRCSRVWDCKQEGRSFQDFYVDICYRAIQANLDEASLKMALLNKMAPALRSAVLTAKCDQTPETIRNFCVDHKIIDTSNLDLKSDMKILMAEMKKRRDQVASMNSIPAH